jgi:Mg-chelatase subunit ChlD
MRNENSKRRTETSKTEEVNSETQNWCLKLEEQSTNIMVLSTAKNRKSFEANEENTDTFDVHDKNKMKQLTNNEPTVKTDTFSLSNIQLNCHFTD